MSEAQNDAGRTIESISNQMRVFNEQTQRLSRAIGSVFLPILETILPYMNAILMVLTEIISTFAIFVGYNEDMMAGFASGDVTEGIWDIDNALTSAGNSAKKLKQGLRSFDKLNVITTPSSGGGAGGGAGAIGGINPDVLNAFNSATEEYQRRLEKIQMKATKIRDSIMEWLGFTKEVDEETGKVSFKFDHITSGTVLGAMAVGGIIYSGAKKTLGFLNKIGLVKFNNFNNLTKNLDSKKIQEATTKFTQLKDSVVGIVTAGTGLFILSDSIKDINENGFGLLNTISLISGSLMSVGGIFKTITSTASLFGVTMSSSMTIATGGLSLLIPLVVGFITHINNASNDTSKFNNKLKEINETFKQLDKTAKEQVSTNQVQINRTQDLVRELENLIDANGKIKEGYEDRTKYILNYVNEALGTEYKLVGNVITQNGKVVKSYKNIQSETQKLINLRKAELVLEAYKDKYVEALKQENNLKNEILDKQLKVNQKQLEYNEYVRQGKDENSSFMISLRNEIAQLEEEKKKQENALAGFQYVIRNYEALQEAHITGSVEKTNELIRKVMTETEISATNTTNNIRKNLDQKFSNFNYNINFNANKTPQFSSFERNLGNLKATVNVDANTTNAQKKINNLGNSLATSFKVAINYDKKYSKIDISGISQNADGGMPPVGQLFIANEKGPEMIGHIGGRSFVANQNQMMDLLDKKIGNAQKNSKGIQNATFIVKFGEEEIARKVINDLEDMADYNGKPIVIGG